jgi:competence protein ComEC
MFFRIPFAWMALFFTAGILVCAPYAASPFRVLPLLALISGAAALFLIRPWRRRHAPDAGSRRYSAPICFLLLTGLCLTGFFRMHQARTPPPGHIYHAFRDELQRGYSGMAALEGRFYRDPSWTGRKCYLYLEATSLTVRGKTRGVCGRVRLSMPWGDQKERRGFCEAGRIARIHAYLYVPRDFLNPGVFSYRDYLRRQKIWLTGYVKSRHLIRITGYRPPAFPEKLLRRVRRHILSSIDGHFSERTGAMMKALLVGERGEMARDVKEDLKKAGLYHILAISGLHMGILCYLVFKLFCAAGSKRFASVCCILFALGYAAITGWNAPVSRAAVMACCYLLGRILGLKGHPVNTLFLAAFVYLFIRPLHLRDPGFQLTFAATLGILTILPALAARCRFFRTRAGALVAASLSAQLCLLPLTCHYFNRVIPFGVPANTLFVPLLAVTLAASLLYLGAAFLYPASAGAAAVLPGLGVQLIQGGAARIASLPWTSYRVPDPFFWVMAGYTGALILVFVPWRRPGPRMRLVLFLLFLTLLVTYPFPPRKVDRLTMTFLDVGDGRAILIEPPGREKILLDGGGFYRSDFDTGEQIVSPVLWRYGVKRLKAVIASHGHRDHYGGLFSVLDNFRVDRLYYGGIPPPKGQYALLLDKARDMKIPVQYPPTGEKIGIGGADILFLAPGRRAPVLGEENDSSLVHCIQYENQAMLLPSDLEPAGEARLAGTHGIGTVSLLEAPHHGSRHSSTPPFIRRFKPVIVVISGDDRRGSDDMAETAVKYERMGARVFRTDRHGAVTAEACRTGLFVYAISPGHPPARCARRR